MSGREESFEFLELVSELRDVIVTECLDRPTRVSLALASKHLYESISELVRLPEGYEFLDDCTRLGYLALIKCAFGESPIVDYTVLALAVKGTNAELAEWLYSKCVRYITKDERFDLAKMAMEKGFASLVKALVKDANASEASTLQNRLANYSIELEAPDSIRALFPERSRLNIDEKTLKKYNIVRLARNGRLEELKLLSPIYDQGETENVSFLVIAIALADRNTSMIEFALKEGSTWPRFPSADFEYLLSLYQSNKPLFSGCSEGLKANWEIFFSHTPRLTPLKYLVEETTLLHDASYSATFFPPLSRASLEEFRYFPWPEPDFREKFACIKYLFDRGLLTWQAEDLWSAPSYANLDQLKWLIANCSKNGKAYTKTVFKLEPLFRISKRIDPETFAFIVSMQNFDQNAAFLACFLENNIEILRTAKEVLGFRDMHSVVINLGNKKMLLHRLAMFYRGFFEKKPLDAKFPHVSKLRSRLGNLIKLIRLIVIEMEMPFSDNPRNLFFTIPNRVFVSRLSGIMTEYWDRISKLDSWY